ncbi:hypothetical protein B0T18DRAFT_230571 [Schizothecium vesticola]|uniref:Uncharacterized protein n=1 Tax=Schizothecium vesticola TaxID=314040 RepID=A0AA40K0F9_9PEZI|nr:hypothetical protein B0T18DRAFT_230571 [Schizothecium vesticola]
MLKLMRGEIRTNSSRPSRFYLSPFPKHPSPRVSMPAIIPDRLCPAGVRYGSNSPIAPRHGTSLHRPGPTPHGHPLRANGRLQKTAPTPLSGPRLSPGTLEPNPKPWPKAVVPKLGRRQRD